MKNILLFTLIALVSCSKPNDIVANRPIKKDVTPPTITLIQPSVVPVGTECNATIIIHDDMSIRAVYYYENNSISRTFETQFSPGNTSTDWEYTFPFYMSVSPTIVKVVAVDMAGNTSETQLIIN